MRKAMLLSLVFSLPLFAGSPTHEKNDIVQVAVSAGSFNTLAAALKAADLVTTLQSNGPFTVFAPTDEAFAKLPAGTVEKLLLPENKAKLQAVLKYHVIAGSLPAAKVVKMSSATTVNGAPVAIKTAGKTVSVGGATVVTTDIHASNGVIHAIDRVMLPPGFSL